MRRLLFFLLLLPLALLAADVTGTWDFSVDLDAGSGNPTFTFKQSGEKLTGHYSGALGEADLAGTAFTHCFRPAPTICAATSKDKARPSICPPTSAARDRKSVV